MTDMLGAAATGSPPILGTAWGCPVCRAEGPLMSSPCPYCQAEVSPVVLTGRKEAARLLNQGLEAARAEFWSDGVDLLFSALDLAGPDPGALGLYGLMLHQTGRTPEALAAWRQAAALGPPVPWPSGATGTAAAEADRAALEAYNAALLSAGWGQWEHALKRLEPATTPDSRLAAAFVVKGLAGWALGRRGLARAAWERALELDPSAPGLQVCMVAMLEDVLSETRSALAAVAPVPQVALPAAAAQIPAETAGTGVWVGPAERTALRPGAPANPARPPSWWIPAVAGLLLATTAGGAAYRTVQVRSQAARAQIEAGRQAAERALSAQAAAEDRAVRSEQATRTAQGAVTAAEAARAQAQAALAQAEATVREAAAREGLALDLLAAANPTGAGADLEQLVILAAEARKRGLTLPDWVVRNLDTIRIRAAVERYFEGYQAFRSGHYAAAVSAFAAALQLDSQVYTADDAAYLAARAEDQAGRPAAAAAWYGRVISEFPASAYVDDALFFGAGAAERAGDRAGAIRWYRELLNRFPGSGYDWDAGSALRRLGG